MSTRKMKAFTEGLKNIEELLKNSIVKIQKAPKSTEADVQEFEQKWQTKIEEFKTQSRTHQKAFFHQHDALNNLRKDSNAAGNARKLKEENEAAIKNMVETIIKELTSDFNVTIETIVDRGVPQRCPNPDLS